MDKAEIALSLTLHAIDKNQMIIQYISSSVKTVENLANHYARLYNLIYDTLNIEEN